MSPGRPFTADDAWSFNGGTHTSAHEVLGAHPVAAGEVAFRVWAPNATAVHVIGDMNGWSPTSDGALDPDPSGVWRGTVAAEVGHRYKYRLTTADGRHLEKADPFAFASEEPPATASVVAEVELVDRNRAAHPDPGP
ncbi:MAG: 1,4-alpha-glucan branching enzyme, partial [Actinomycetota bacterium]